MFVYPVCTYYCTPLFEIVVFPIGTLKQRRQQMKQNTDCLGYRGCKFHPGHRSEDRSMSLKCLRWNVR